VKPRDAVVWVLLGIWATWLFALSAELGLAFPGRWAPNLGWALLASLAAHARTRVLPLVAVVFALARSATSIDSPLANLAACLAFVGAFRMLRLVLDIAQPAPLAVLTFGATLACEGWYALVRQTQVERALTRAALDAVSHEPLWGSLLAAGAGALSTAALVWMAAPALRRLPGLSELERKKAWPAAASSR
jgi:hypothetical protein